LKKGFIFIALSTVFFSTMEIALKMVTGIFNPIQLTFLRFLIGGIVLLPLAVKGLRARQCRLRPKDFAFFALTGFICVVVSMVLYQLAIVYAPANIVAVLFSCNPVFVVIFAFILLHEPIRRHTVASILVSFSGILVIMNPLHMAGSAAGILLTILAAVTFALYGAVGRTRSDRYGGVAMTSMSFLLGSAEMAVLIAFSHIPAVASAAAGAGLRAFAAIPVLQGVSLQTLPSLIYIGIFVTGLGYTFYFLAMESTSAAMASLVFFIKPALAPVLALLILREPIGPLMLTGIGMILAGSLISFVPGVLISRNAERMLIGSEEDDAEPDILGADEDEEDFDSVD
jgi:drug/metabolite transporter (DMT)-like permease